MNADLERLIRLQRLDGEIARKSALLETELPREIEKLRAAFQSASDALKNHDAQMTSLAKRRRELEMEADTAREGIKKSKQKLNEVKTNVEYRAILKESETQETRIRELEDQQLEVMEAAETRAKNRAALDKASKEEEARYQKEKVEREQAMAQLKEALDALKKDRAAVTGDISPDILAIYEKVSRQRNGVGIAPVADRSCAACHQLIPPQLYYQIRTTEEIHQCPHCNRFLYFIPPATEGAEPG